MEKDEIEDLKEGEEGTSSQLLRLFMQKLMGRSLDYARVSGMSDRSFEQFRKSLKDDAYSTLEHFIKLFDQLTKNSK